MEQKHKRQKEIRNDLLINKKVYVNELAKKLNVSTRTIRNDLAELSEKNKCILFHGGAKVYTKPIASLFNQSALHGIAVKKPTPKVKSNVKNTNSVYILGSFNVDIVMEMDKFPQSEETRHATNTAFFPGGKGLNQALAASKIINSVHLTVKIGDDNFAEQAKAFLHYSDIQSIRILEAKAKSTGHAIILNNQLGECLITCNLGANESLTIDELKQDFDLIDDAQIVLTQLENNFEITKWVILQAHELKKTVILHLSPYKAKVTELLHLVDILTLGVIEAEAIFNISINNIEDAKKALWLLHEKGVKHSIIFMKNKGYIWFDGKQCHLFSLHKSAVVDTSGMMDAFTGALAGCLADQQSMDAAITFSCDFASLKIEQKGASTMPNRELVQVFNHFKIKT